MNLNIKKLSENAANVIKINDNVVAFSNVKAEVAVDESNKSVIVYRTNCSFEIPEGYVAILSAGQNIPGKSLDFVSPIILPAGVHTNFTGFFKINTDAMPTFFKPEEEVVRFVVIPVETLTIDVEEYIAPVIEETVTNTDNMIVDGPLQSEEVLIPEEPHEAA